MVVLFLERVPRGLRGELTRWMLEPRANVFVGTMSAMVRERLWGQICSDSKGGSALLIYTTDNEQGFAYRLWGAPSHYLEDFEGLLLVRTPSGS
ncbi:MAG: type I-E CRISPR-associated endoribonuclease Cas2 [Dehalococcoidia bacterium]|nr:type I-E CRISPR-associated endoribonuclease Cas2 [Dehalococcoidia bacterium]